MIYVKLNEAGWPVERRGDDWPGRTRIFSNEAELAAWTAAHAGARPTVLPAEADPEWWWVSKDAIVMRIAAVGDAALLALDQIVSAQPRAKQIIWENAQVFRSDNQELRALATALIPLGVNPDVVFARDPLAPPTTKS